MHCSILLKIALVSLILVDNVSFGSNEFSEDSEESLNEQTIAEVSDETCGTEPTCSGSRLERPIITRVPKYKVTYFDVMGLGEPIRYLLSYGDIDFEDVRIQGEQWPQLKPGTPFGKVPLLEVDGLIAHQSIAIARYLSKKVGLSGADDWQNLKIDATVDTVVDLRIAVFNAFFADEATKAQKIETVQKETLPFYLGKLDDQIKENGGYLVDKKLTWADLHIAAAVESISGALQSEIVAEYANLKSLVEKVWELPNIKAWRDKRPKTAL